MPNRAEIVRWIVALLIGAAGTLGVVGLSLGMNAQLEKSVPQAVTSIETVELPNKPKPVQNAKKQRTSPVRRASRSAPSPGPLLTAGLAGLDFGLGGAADLALAEATAALVDDMSVVLDEGQVQNAPRARTRVAPEFPTRARAQGITGSVTLFFVVDVDGSVQDVYVVESIPAGVFDEAAIEAVKQWEFDPGLHEGMPVAVRVRQTLTFSLD
jgi:protein TonB